MMSSKLKVLQCLTPNVGTTAEDIANETGLGLRTVYRALEWANIEGKANLLNPNCKPHEWVLNGRNADNNCSMSLAMATMLIHTKKFASQQLPKAVFNSLVREGVYEVAESIAIKAKKSNPLKKELHFEQSASGDCLLELYSASGIDSSMIDVIKNALYDDSDLEIKLLKQEITVYVKPEKLQMLDGKFFLKVKQLDYPKTLKRIDLSNIKEIHVVDYCAFQSPSQMRRAA